MGFNVNLPVGIMTGNIEFKNNKVSSIEKVLHDIQRYVLLNVATNLTKNLTKNCASIFNGIITSKYNINFDDYSKM